MEVLSASARGDYLIEGSFKDYGDFHAWLGRESLLAVGGSVYFQQGEYGTSTDEAEVLRWSADTTYKNDGLSVFVAVVGNHISEVAGVADMDQLGLLFQTGYMLSEDTEIVARYEWGDLDAPGIEDLSIATIGLNHYIKKHQLKLMADVGYSFNAINTVDGVGVNWASDSPGWRPDMLGTDGQIVVRSQVQLGF